MTEVEKNSPIESLHKNVSGFFERFYVRYKEQMKCSKGCSACCISGISVFPVEAHRIVAWFDSLDTDAREKLKARWVEKLSSDATLSSGCAFLDDNTCSIYEARPTLCRSQGLPLRIKSSEMATSAENQTYELSLCELNFQPPADLPGTSEWLDLDRLNSLISIAQQSFVRGNDSELLRARLCNEDARIPLELIRNRLSEE